MIHRHLDFSKVAFDDFICKNFTETSECNTYIELKELNNQFQAFICEATSKIIFLPVSSLTERYLNRLIKCFIRSLTTPLKIINIPFLKNAKINKYTSTTPIGPREFVNLIKDAQVLYTS